MILSSKYHNPTTLGYMPLKSNYGFLTPQATIRDAAHELGHGVFNLRHTFSPHNHIVLDEGSTLNLMDYSTGNELFKYQWDFIHNPEGGWFVWEDEEEGAMFNSQWDGKVKAVIDKIKYNNIYGIGNDFYLTFEDEEDIFFFGRNIVLGNKTFDYIRIDGTITQYDNNWQKTIVSNMYSKGNARNERIPHTSIRVEVVTFGFLKYDNTYQKFVPADFEIIVLKEDAEEFEEYISSVTGLKLDAEEMMNKATSVAASIPGLGSQCNAGLRQYVLELVGDSILFPTHLGGKVPVGSANDIYAFLEENHMGITGIKKFHEVSFHEAISLCQLGYLIVTAYYNPAPEGSGHVNALLPEVVQGNWNWYINGLNDAAIESIMPIVFDTGGGKRWPNLDISESDRKLTNAYIRATHSEVKFYMYLKN